MLGYILRAKDSIEGCDYMVIQNIEEFKGQIILWRQYAQNERLSYSDEKNETYCPQAIIYDRIADIMDTRIEQDIHLDAEKDIELQQRITSDLECVSDTNDEEFVLVIDEFE